MSYSLTPYAVDLPQLSAALGSRDADLLKRLRRQFREELAELDELAAESAGEEPDAPGPAPEERAAALGQLSQFLAGARQDLAAGADPSRLLSGLTSLSGVPSGMKDALRGLLDDSEPEPDTPEGPRLPSAAAALRQLVFGEPKDDRAAFLYGSLLELLCRRFGEPLQAERWSGLRHGSRWFQVLDRALQEAGVQASVFSITDHLVERGAPVAIPRSTEFPSVGYVRHAEVAGVLEALRPLPPPARGDDEDPAMYLADVRAWLERCAASGRDLVCFYG